MKLAPPRTRTLLLALTLLVAAQVALAVATYWRSIHDQDEGFRFPLPTRIAAMIESAEAIPPKGRSALLEALSSDNVSVWLATSDTLNIPKETRAQLPQAKAILSQYVDTLKGREVRAWLSARDGSSFSAPRFERLRLWSKHPMRIAVRLSDGDWLVVESVGNHAEALLGIPYGFWSGLLGIMVASLALLTLWRGLAPLECLAASVERFAVHAVPETSTPTGPRETRRIIEAFNSMQSRIASLISERRVMFGALSHDLRTYLTRLRLRVELIDDTDLRGRTERDIEAMADIVEDALLLARIDAAPTQTGEKVEVAALVKKITEDPRLANEQAQFRHFGADLYVLGDGFMLLSAVQNLVQNAYAYAGGCELAFEVEGAKLRIDVMDRGPGIAEPDRARLLEPFERGNPSRSLEIPGSGLGLAIASRAAERSGGELQLIDRAGGGLLARLELPLSQNRQIS